MGDTGLLDLVVRAVVSLAVVLAVVGVAYLVARRRTTGGRPAVRAPSRRRAATPGVEVVGRIGLGRSSAAVAVRFGDKVMLIASSEQGPATTLAEMPAERWDELRTVREPIEAIPARHEQPVGAARPNLLEALRQATARHG